MGGEAKDQAAAVWLPILVCKIRDKLVIGQLAWQSCFSPCPPNHLPCFFLHSFASPAPSFRALSDSTKEAKSDGEVCCR
jgi:hypothetical protein